MNVFDTALALLKKDPWQNALLLGQMQNGAAADVAVKGNSVRVLCALSGQYHFSAEDPQEFLDLLTPVAHEAKVFFVSDASLAGLLRERLPDIDILACYDQWVLQPQVELIPRELPGVDFVPVGREHLPTIYARSCDEEFDEANLLWRLTRLPSVAALVEGKLAGYFFLHENGEFGPALVLEPYRKLGLGTELFTRICMEQRKLNRIPVGHANPANVASAKMMARMGAIKTARQILWIYRGDWRNKP